jgi:outer membrane protein assembly factor BamA
MKHPAPLRVVLAGILSVSFCCPTFGQTSWKAAHCQQLVMAPDPPGPEIVIDDVTLDGAADVPDTVWNRIVSEIKATRFIATGLRDELQEVGLRGGLQDFGYFNPLVSAQVKVITSSPTLQHVSVSAHVNAGSRYTLSKVQFRSVDSSQLHLPFPAEELRPLVPLRDGDIFSGQKVREGLDALRKYYRSDGYIDFVSVAEFKIDELHQQITLVIVLQEGPQFRFGNIEVLGLDSALENELRSKIRSGDLVNFQLIVDFYQEHKSELPDEDLPEDTAFIPHIKEGTADALFDFRSCAQLQK